MSLFGLFSGKKKTPNEYLVDGNYKAALKGFLEQAKTKTDSPSLMNKIADLYRRSGKNRQAIEYYIHVGDYYGNRGFFNKSVAAFKKALNIEPNNEEVLGKLSEYNEKVPKYMIDRKILDQIRQMEGGEEETVDAIVEENEAEVIEPPVRAEGLKEEIEEKSDGAQAMAMGPATDGEVPSPRQDDPVQDGPEQGDPVQDAVEDALFIDADQLLAVADDSDDGLSAETKEETDESPVETPSEVPAENPVEVSQAQPEAKAPAEVTSESIQQDEDVDLQPDAFWDEEIDFDTKVTIQPSLEDAGDNLKVAAIPGDDPELDDILVDDAAVGVDEEPSSVNLFATALVEAKDDSSVEDSFTEAVEETGGMVFKKRGADKPKVDDTRDMDFANFDDAIDSLFTVSAEPQKPSSREENRKHWPLFRTMPKEVFLDVVLALDERSFGPGDWVVRQGDPGSEMFLITEGSVEVLTDDEGTVRRLASLEEGDFFGEAALLTNRPRNASIRSVTETEVLILDRPHFTELIKSHPSVFEILKSVHLTRTAQK